jgi:hypothetical protein
MVKINWLLILITLFFWSCSKNSDCFNYSEQERRVLEIPTDSLAVIELFNQMEFSYKESTENKVVIQYPSTLQNSIQHSLQNHVFTLKNIVGCKILRNNSKDIIQVILHQKTLPKVILHNQSSFINSEKIKQNLHIETFVSSGTISLELDNNETIIKLESSAMNVNLKGKTNYMYIYSLGTGVINARNLDANILHINNHSTGDAQIQAKDLTIEQYGFGNIIIHNNPININIAEHLGKGKIIKQ